MANIQIFEINEDGELLVNDPALAGALQELTPEELNMITGGRGVNIGKCDSGSSGLNIGNCTTKRVIIIA
ncbi:hypothetical protein H6F62_05315 [Anabaena sp. FACHB-1391]|uniref:hypothetical protein n=1 Tax=Anabaena sp. FACHB-1391 TaxID=2692771 RepID=UPI001680313E|nr:hypothetical protein [Anabaena sp. FACHB-1391]MBD2268216.1 hypothetical protein [Anabaena sp. FACHB-1391]